VTELIDYLVKLEQVDKTRRLDSNKSIKPDEGKHQRTNMIRGDNNDEQHDTDDMDNNEDINNPKEVRACPTCGKHHCGRCWHKNKKMTSKAKSFVLVLMVNRVKKRCILWKRLKN
jgi:hypothetical protein